MQGRETGLEPDRAPRPIPRLHLIQGLGHGGRVPIAADQRAYPVEVLGFAEQEDDLGRFVSLERRTGSGSPRRGRSPLRCVRRARHGPERPGRRPTRAGRGTRPGRPVTVLGRRLTSAKATESRLVDSKGIPRQECAGVRVDLGHQVHRRLIPRWSPTPIRRRRLRTAASPAGRRYGVSGGST